MQEIIRWQSGYNIGIQVIDEQHQHMIEIINTLFQELETKMGEIDVPQFFDDAVNYSDYHFQTEETFFSHYEYPEREQHLAAHQTYKATLHDLLLQEGDSHQKANQLLDFLEKWWIGHITGMDQTLRDLPKKETTQG